MIVRWGLDELPGLLAELGVERPLLVASPRWSPPVDVAGVWSEVPSDFQPSASSLDRYWRWRDREKARAWSDPTFTHPRSTM